MTDPERELFVTRIRQLSLEGTDEALDEIRSLSNQVLVDTSASEIPLWMNIGNAVLSAVISTEIAASACPHRSVWRLLATAVTFLLMGPALNVGTILIRHAVSTWGARR